jgi:ornithine decarboxylase
MVMAPSAITNTEEYAPIQIHNETIYKCSTYIENLNKNGETAKALIGNALQQRINTINHEVCEAGDEDAFFVADMGEVYRQHLRWKLNLPRVKPHYGKTKRT